MSSEELLTVHADLARILQSPRTVSASRVSALTVAALRFAETPDLARKFGEAVADFIAKCAPCHKLSGLYIVDSVVRGCLAEAKRRKFSANVYSQMFTRLLPPLSPQIKLAPSSDKAKIRRLLSLWKDASVFPLAFIEKAESKWVGVEDSLPNFSAAAQLLNLGTDFAVPLPQRGIDPKVAQNLLDMVDSSAKRPGPWTQSSSGCSLSEIKVLSRTLMARGFAKSLSELLIVDLFGPFGLVEHVVVRIRLTQINSASKSAQFKLKTRAMALEAKNSMNSKETHAGVLEVCWACGFGPKTAFIPEEGASILPIDSLDSHLRSCLISSRVGGVREGAFRGGITVEEPDL